jgi:DNA-binding NarL/FixJ family response regulator
MKDLKLLIADDHPMILKGMKAEFDKRGFLNLYEAVNGVDALKIIEENDLDIAILDVDMPMMSGMEVAKRLKDTDVKTILITHHKEDGFIIQAVVNEVNAYLLKEDSFSEIEKAIEHLQEHDFYLSTSFEAGKLDHIAEQILLLKNLSLAEREVIKRISEGFETAEVAEMLAVSKRTVQKHRSNIIHKLNLPSDRNALADYAEGNKQLIKEIYS